MNKLLSNRAVSTSLAFLPLVVFMRVSQHYGFTDPGWMRGFLSGSALTVVLLGLFAAARARVRDILFASGLLLFSGALAFLAEIGPMLVIYKRFQGSVYMLWYLLVRALFAFSPRLIGGFVYDPYAACPGRAAVFAAAVFGWSLCFSGLLLSIVLPVILMTGLLYRAESGAESARR